MRFIVLIGRDEVATKSWSGELMPLEVSALLASDKYSTAIIYNSTTDVNEYIRVDGVVYTDSSIEDNKS